MNTNEMVQYFNGEIVELKQNITTTNLKERGMKKNHKNTIKKKYKPRRKKKLLDK